MTSKSGAPRPTVLCVLDGWGWRDESADNATRQGQTPVFERLWQSSPHTLIQASGEAVGLPAGQMGNSEVGHMNLGAGRVVFQDLPMIDRALAAGELDHNQPLADFSAKLKASGGSAHVIGLLSPGGVHSHQHHIAALVRWLTRAGVPVVVHALTDGRDVPPRSGHEQLAAFLAGLADLGPALKVGTVIGRYFAMDRDQRWQRVERAWRALVLGEGKAAIDPLQVLSDSYAADVGDEFVEPAVIAGYAGMADGDGVLMANFRADRAREILTALLDPAFTGFARPRTPAFAAALGMVEYSSALNAFLPALFPPKRLEHGLGQVIADAGLTQLRIAETEKYPHVTFFFNGGEETCYPGEERILVPSLKVATYDLEPAMSAVEVCNRLVAAIESARFDVVVVNFANPDMVGHTGFMAAAVTAVATVDQCLGRLEQAVTAAGGVLLVTADHGNCELMRDPETGGPHTAHTTNPVPLILVNAREQGLTLAEGGRLADVAPTLLALMGLPQPAEMTGHSLLRPAGAARAAA